MSFQGPVLDYQPPEPEHKIGTLTYTTAGLITVFVWLLWGNVVFTLVEAIFPNSMPLQLYRLNVDPGWIPILMNAMTQIINLIMVVPLGFRSDRTRTRWGRRIPFIVGSMPLVFLSLCALGFTDDIGRILNHSGLPARLHLHAIVVITVIVGIMVTTFDISNVFVTSMYDYLIADVIPQKMLARYMGSARMAGQVASIFFYFFVFRHLETHTSTVYIGAALLYLVGFGLLCFNVCEGQYPKPHDYQKRQPFSQTAAIFFRECFTHPLYISMYIASALWAASYACNSYRLIFYHDVCGFTLDDISRVKGWSGAAALFIAIPIGWLVDKIHPIRGLILSIALTTPFTLISFYMPNFTWFTWIAVLTLPTDISFECSDAPLRMHIFPHSQYGQFASATAFIRSATLVVASFIAGSFIRHMHQKHGDRGYAYCFIWQGAFSILALIAFVVVYFFWKRFGDMSRTNAEELDAVSTEIVQN